MNYKLVVLTHGNAEPLAETLESFASHVTPAPSSAYLHVDAEERVAPVYAALQSVEECRWTVRWRSRQVGFCEASTDCWQNAAEGDHEFVFWLEHDFLFSKPVDLEQLASVLDANSQLAQMALMRQPVNKTEWDAGGVVASRPGQFEPRGGWMEQRAYWTTNPSLFRRDFAAKHPWPEGGECEGRFGIALRELGYSFGMWGAGEAWVEHVGTRTGFGY